jgi:hypothetical protein
LLPYLGLIRFSVEITEELSSSLKRDLADVMAQTVELLPSKCEVLSSNPCATKKKKQILLHSKC